MKAKARYKWIIFGLFFLLIPSINIVDIFPDFIAYFILAKVMSYGINKLPYFEEAKNAFIKLGIINLFKLPVLLLVNFIRMNNRIDTDVFALSTLCFSIVETLYLIPAISNLFNALFYLGERTETTALIDKLRLVGPMYMESTTIKETTYFFAVAKAILAFVPETFLMTAADQNGSNLTLHPYAKFYPIALSASFVLSLVIGIFWFFVASKYASKIGKQKSFYTSIDSLVTGEMLPEIEKKQKIKNINAALNLMIAASAFTIEINFANFGNVNILPHFIYAVVLFAGVYKLIGKTTYTYISASLTAIYTVISLVSHALLISFLEKWSYNEIKLLDGAREAYQPVITMSIIEFAAIASIIAVTFLVIRRFFLENTKISPNSEKYSSPDRDFHKSLLIKNFIYSVIAILTALSKLITVLLNAGSEYIFTGTSGGVNSSILVNPLPWFSTFSTFLTIFYICYSFYFFGIIKDEAKMKYR